MSFQPQITEPAVVEAVLDRMAEEIKALFTRQGRMEPAIIGIHTGGVWVAEALRSRLGLGDPVGRLNIAFYRDDFSRIGNHPTVTPSDLPFPVEGRHLLLVDDILYTGRTVRAAMNEIFDYGRPASITLAVLVDRGERELPVHAAVVGIERALKPGEYLKLNGPSPLALHVALAGGNGPATGSGQAPATDTDHENSAGLIA
jgi:pyrimidine operon attenuation protein/uracil phosphoribosyltransferase